MVKINYNELLKVKIIKNTKTPATKWKESNIKEINGNYNVGIKTGKENNIIVIDVDSKDEGIEEMEKYIKEYGEPETVKQRSVNGGYHLFFEYEHKDDECKYLIENYLKNKVGCRDKGIDVRTTGGYIMSHPSTIDGKQYIYERGFDKYEVMEIPKTLLLFLLIEKKEEKKIDMKLDKKNILNTNVEIELTDNSNELYKKFILYCLSKERATNYTDWINVGFALKNGLNNDDGIELFDLFSQKCIEKYDKINVEKYWNNIKISKDKKYTIRSLYYWSKKDNKEKFIELLKEDKYYKNIGDKLNETDIVRYIKKIEPNNFIWSNNILYCYDGVKWNIGELEMHKFIGTILYEHYLDLIITYKIEDKEFPILKKVINRFKTLSFKKDLVLTSKEVFTNNKIEFDMKGELIGFDNGVYDLKNDIFRNYHYDDYITFTTGHNFYEKCDIKKKDELKEFIKSFMPDDEIRKLYMEILATGLEGKTLKNFIIFNGKGGNGKSIMDEYMGFLLGDYAYIDCPSALLTEKQNSNANPAKFKLNKKRFVCVKEPNEDMPFQNAIIKELTGGSRTSGRNLHSNNCDINLHLTLIVEANKVPILSAEPTDGELRRYIDLLFPYKFSYNDDEIDNITCFRANNKYEKIEWKNEYKNEMYHILIDNFKTYKNNNNELFIPKKVRERTKNYLEKSILIMNFFNVNYEITNDNNFFVKIDDIINSYKESDDYKNLNKECKRKLTKEYFINFFKDNVKFNKLFCERKKINGIDYRNILLNYKNIINF